MNLNELWAFVIRSIYGLDGGIGNGSLRSVASIWLEVIRSSKILCIKDIDLLSLCNREIGDSQSIAFWHDVWCGVVIFR